MCSTCNHHLVFNFSRTGGKIIVREALFIYYYESKDWPFTTFLSPITVHKFVDVKTKKSKEVRVDAFFTRECTSGDRFRDFFLFVFLHSSSSRRHSFVCKEGIPLFSARFSLSSVTRAQYSVCTLSSSRWWLPLFVISSSLLARTTLLKQHHIIKTDDWRERVEK